MVRVGRLHARLFGAWTPTSKAFAHLKRLLVVFSEQEWWIPACRKTSKDVQIWPHWEQILRHLEPLLISLLWKTWHSLAAPWGLNCQVWNHTPPGFQCPSVGECKENRFRIFRSCCTKLTLGTAVIQVNRFSYSRLRNPWSQWRDCSSNKTRNRRQDEAQVRVEKRETRKT